MRESRTWQYIKDHAPSWFCIERFEVLHPPGGSDCFWTDNRDGSPISGWLELKYCEPDDREFLRGRIPKLKPEQPMFLRRQAEHGVPAGILLRVGADTWYLFRADRTHGWVNRIRSTDAMTMAKLLKGPLDFGELAYWLTR